MKSPTKIRIFSLLGLMLLISCEKEKRRLPMDADGNTYDTVVIGRQVWLSENLKTTRYNTGTSIPLLTDNNAWSGTGMELAVGMRTILIIKILMVLCITGMQHNYTVLSVL